VRRRPPPGSSVEVTAGSVGGAFAFEATGDVYDLAREAFETAYGNAPVEAGIGGSIPFIAQFARAYPSIDESLRLGMWERACVAEVLLQRLAPATGGATPRGA